VNAISVYDSVTNLWHLLPPVPSGINGIPEECGCVSLANKLYVIGGRGKGPLELRDEVYAFDFVGKAGWKQCASMITGRAAVACEAKDGKIYVFGGLGAQGTAEVYDPEDDTWRGIAPMLSTRMHHKVVIVGGEFYVQLGKILGRNHNSDALAAEVYNPEWDRWRKVENFNFFVTSARAIVAETMLSIDGRLHKILDDVLYLFDESSREWKVSQSISWDIFDQQRCSNRTLPFADAASALAVNGELLALVYGRTVEGYMELTPLKSEGLGVKNRPLVWKRIQCSLGFLHSHSMCTIDL
jgi:N-acetylneuraminic acid mutarotase